MSTPATDRQSSWPRSVVPTGLGARFSNTDIVGARDSWTSVLDPSDRSIVARTGAASSDEVERAAEAAERGWDEWRLVDAEERARCLRTIADDLRGDAAELAQLITAETGKLLREAHAEVDLSCRYLEWFASIVPRRHDSVHDLTEAHVTRLPVGPVAAITTWNFPLSIPVRKIAPAIAAGCSVILKPSPLAPASAYELVRRCEQHLPPGVIGLVLGDAEQAVTLACSDAIRAVSFTGSTENGIDLAGRLAPRLTRSILELGGRAPVIVLPDVDIDQAAETVMEAKFRNNGASCIAANNVFVHDDVAESLLAALEERVSALVPGDPRSEATSLGPLRTAGHARAIEDLAADAEDRGCRVVRGRQAENAGSDCYASAVLVHADHDPASWDREVFGPLLQVRTFRDTDRVVDEINGWRRGLGGYVVAPEAELATALARRLRIGILGVGTGSPNSPELPFGGFDLAGWGREGSVAGLDAFVEQQSISYGA